MNKKSLSKKLSLLLLVGVMSLNFTACAIDIPEYKTISPSQTAYLVPLSGDNSSQGIFSSETLLAKAKVPTKEVRIPHVKRKVGFMSYRYVPSATLVIVERKPVSREWTSDDKTGTSIKNECIKAETKESIAFSANMSATAQIDEANTTKFLYRYNNTSLNQIMDTEIRTRVQTVFVEQCSKYNLADLLIHKEDIMKIVRNNVIPYFAERGITITQIGLKGDLSYDNKAIQESIDNTFKAEKGLEAQRLNNENTIEKAKADAQAVEIQASTMDSQLKLKELENQSKAIDKWDGKFPTVQGNGQGMIFNIPATTK